MKNIKLILISMLLVIGCDEDSELANILDGLGDTPLSGNGMVHGSFEITSATVYQNEECDGDGITHMCTDDYDNEADCIAAGEEWIPVLDALSGGNTYYFIFDSSGTWISPSCDVNEYTINTEIGIVTLDDSYCEGVSNGGDFNNEADCIAAGGSWDPEFLTGTLNYTDQTMTILMSDEAGCSDCDGCNEDGSDSVGEAECEAAVTDAECEALCGHWEEIGSCTMLGMTYNSEHDGTCIDDHDECESDDDCESDETCEEGECVYNEGDGEEDCDDNVVDIEGTWELESQEYAIYLTTNETLTILDNENSGTGAITVTGDLSTNLDYLNIEIWTDYYDEELDFSQQVIQVENAGCIEDNGNCDRLYLYENGDIYLYTENYDDVFSSDADSAGTLQYQLDGNTLTITEPINISRYEWNEEQQLEDTITVMISGTLTGATIDFYSGQSTMLDSDSDSSDGYEQDFFVFNSDGSFSEYSQENCDLYLDQDGCEDNYRCEWNEDGSTCIDFICSEQTNQGDCWNGPCDWDDDLDTCISDEDDEDMNTSWSLCGDELTLSQTYYYDGYTNGMSFVFVITSDQNGNITLSRDMDLCTLYGYYEDGYEEGSCFENFAENTYGLESDQIESIDFTQLISLSQSMTRDYFSSKNKTNIFLENRAKLNRLIN